MTPEQFAELKTNDALRKRLAKLMALQCFRNTKLEDFHAGTFPSSQSGDYSDVKIVSPFGEITWAQHSRMSDDEMKLLMIDVVNHCYRFISELFQVACGEATVDALMQRDPIAKWYDPD